MTSVCMTSLPKIEGPVLISSHTTYIDESMLEAFVNVWALQQFDERLWMPALQTKFAEYIVDLENPHER